MVMTDSEDRRESAEDVAARNRMRLGDILPLVMIGLGVGLTVAWVAGLFEVLAWAV